MALQLRFTMFAPVFSIPVIGYAEAVPVLQLGIGGLFFDYRPLKKILYETLTPGPSSSIL
jgi:hypothetical protein